MDNNLKLVVWEKYRELITRCKIASGILLWMMSQDYVIDEINPSPSLISFKKLSMLRGEILRKNTVSMCWYILK